MESRRSIIGFLAIIIVSVLTSCGVCKNESMQSKTVKVSNVCELKKFTVKASGEKVYINWSSIANFNNFYFVLEKSTDGVFYEVVCLKKGFISPAAQELMFSYVDKRNSSACLVTYRLKAIQPIKVGEEMLVNVASGENLLNGQKNMYTMIENSLTVSNQLNVTCERGVK